jgi:hypothetical protein
MLWQAFLILVRVRVSISALLCVHVGFSTVVSVLWPMILFLHLSHPTDGNATGYPGTINAVAST